MPSELRQSSAADDGFRTGVPSEALLSRTYISAIRIFYDFNVNSILNLPSTREIGIQYLQFLDDARV